MKKRVLLFQPIIAPYRIDMVNELVEHYDLKVCVFLKNLLEQKFDITRLYEERLNVKPVFLLG